nr:MAG TPA: hypothetical protein [Caudoviricetes sp.]
MYSPPIRVYYPLALFRHPAEAIGHTSPVRVYLPLFGLLACIWA